MASILKGSEYRSLPNLDGVRLVSAELCIRWLFTQFAVTCRNWPVVRMSVCGGERYSEMD